MRDCLVSAEVPDWRLLPFVRLCWSAGCWKALFLERFVLRSWFGVEVDVKSGGICNEMNCAQAVKESLHVQLEVGPLHANLDANHFRVCACVDRGVRR